MYKYKVTISNSDTLMSYYVDIQDLLELEPKIQDCFDRINNFLY